MKITTASEEKVIKRLNRTINQKCSKVLFNVHLLYLDLLFIL